MSDLIDEITEMTSEGILNWILLLTIFSIITVIGNCAGYKHPISDSLVGIVILSSIVLLSVFLERKLPIKIPSIIFIIIISIIVAFPAMPSSHFVLYYVSQMEILSIGTVFIGYVGIGLIGNETEFKEDRLRVIIFTILVILSSYMGYAMVDMLF